MIKCHYPWIIVPALLSLMFMGLTLLRPIRVKAQPPQQFPIVDRIASKVVQKYQNSSCEQLREKKHTPPSPEEQRAIQVLKTDPQMRTEFINRIAAPVANKLFECGLLP